MIKYLLCIVAGVIIGFPMLLAFYSIIRGDTPNVNKNENDSRKEGELSVHIGQLQDGHVIYIPMICRREYKPGNPEIGTIGHSYYYNDYLRPWNFGYIRKCKRAKRYNDRQGKPFFASGTEAGALEIIEIVKSKTIQ